MKKVSLVALVAALTASTFAANAQNAPAHCPKAFQGFFLGGNVGLGIGAGSQSYNASEATGDVTTNLISSGNRLGVRGFDGGVNVGYNHRFCNFGLGLEFVANWTNVKGSRGGSFGDVSFRESARLNNSLQLRANFSYVIANLVAPKLIVGWDASKWKQKSALVGGGTFNDAGEAVGFTAGKSKYLNAILFGAGVDFLATRHLVLGFEATVSLPKKGSFSRTFNNTAVAIRNGAPDSVTQKGSFRPQPYGAIKLTAKFIY